MSATWTGTDIFLGDEHLNSLPGDVPVPSVGDTMFITKHLTTSAIRYTVIAIHWSHRNTSLADYSPNWIICAEVHVELADNDSKGESI